MRSKKSVQLYLVGIIVAALGFGLWMTSPPSNALDITGKIMSIIGVVILVISAILKIKNRSKYSE